MLVLFFCAALFGCHNTMPDRFAERLIGLDSLSYRLVVVEDGVYPDGQTIKEPWTIADVQVTQDINESNWVGELSHGCNLATSEHSWIGKAENLPRLIDKIRRAKFLGREDGLYKYKLVYGNPELTITHIYWLCDYIMKWRTTQQSNEKNDTGRVTRTRTYSNYKGVKK